MVVFGATDRMMPATWVPCPLPSLGYHRGRRNRIHVRRLQSVPIIVAPIAAYLA